MVSWFLGCQTDRCADYRADGKIKWHICFCFVLFFGVFFRPTNWMKKAPEKSANLQINQPFLNGKWNILIIIENELHLDVSECLDLRSLPPENGMTFSLTRRKMTFIVVFSWYTFCIQHKVLSAHVHHVEVPGTWQGPQILSTSIWTMCCKIVSLRPLKSLDSDSSYNVFIAVKGLDWPT